MRDRRGQALVEMALSMVILLLLLLGITQFGMIFGAQLMLNHGAREGARLGAVGGSNAEIRQRVVETVPFLDNSYTPLIVRNSQGVRVTVHFDVPVFTPFMANFLGGNTFRTESEVIMRRE